MCEAVPYHSVQTDNNIFDSWDKVKGVISSKMWIIDRSYAASPERTIEDFGNEGNWDKFDALVEKITEEKFCELDSKIKYLKGKKFTGNYEQDDEVVLYKIIR